MDDSVKFKTAKRTNPTVSEEPVKSLGRWYDATLKDTKRGEETKATSAERLEKINQCGLQRKFKVWCLQFMLIPKLLWPSLIYDILAFYTRFAGYYASRFALDASHLV